MNVYEIVTKKIIKKLEEGTIPWRKPWSSNGMAVNYITQKAYSGINSLLLDPGEYATFKQVTERGGKVKKGAKSELVVFWKMIDGIDEDGNPKKVPYLRYYKVFNIKDCEELPSRSKCETFDNSPIERAEEIKEGYRKCPPVTFAPGRAYYKPSTDIISVPELNDYKKPEEFYSTMFHEMVHSTGHKSRLNRNTITDIAAFGSETYSKEELVAEIGSAFLCSFAGIDHAVIDNQAAYINGWLRKLKDDPKMVVSAAGQAQKAANHILGMEV